MIPSLPRPAWLRAATALYVVAFFAFLFLPLIVVAVFAFNDAPYPAPPWHGFTLDWFLGNSDDRARRIVRRLRSSWAASGRAASSPAG